MTPRMGQSMSRRISRIYRVALATTLSLLVVAAFARQPSRAFPRISGTHNHLVKVDGALRAVALAVGAGRATDRKTNAGAVPSGDTDFGPEEPADVADDQRIMVEHLSSPKNFEVTLRLKPTSSKAKGAVALRLLTPHDYYAVQIDAPSERVVFARVSQGKSAEIAAAEFSIGNAWHSLNIRAQDNHFMVTLDGKWLFTAYDAVLSRPGQVALWTSRDGAVEFDDFSIKPLGPE
jgi:hypothetical protein